MHLTSRRRFLCRVGSGIGGVAMGFALADRLGFAHEWRGIVGERLKFGALDPLVDLMQSTPADALLPELVKRLKEGASLSDLVGAAALANARALGGTNYNGYHALMAMPPAFAMSKQMAQPQSALPVLKVLHRSARFIANAGRSDHDALEPLAPIAPDPAPADVTASARRRDLDAAERGLAALAARSPLGAFETLEQVVRDDVDVHRVVLSWRSFDLLRFTGDAQAQTLLRQSLRFCISNDQARERRGAPPNAIAELLPKLLVEHKLEGRERGTRKADDAWIESLASTVFSSDGATAARAAASALAEGFDPEDVGAALALAATKLLLHDPGRTREEEGKPLQSVHGASVGVHASDSTNAWRHISRIGSASNAFASLITGAFHTAGQSSRLAAQPFDHDGELPKASDPAELLRQIDGAVRGRDQRGACLAARRYCALNHPASDLFALLLGFAIEQDGALHAEKYFLTISEEHAAARPAHRALHLAALTRVTASGYGFPAPGLDEARRLLAT